MTNTAQQLPPEFIHDALDFCKAHSIATSSETEATIDALIDEAEKISKQYFEAFMSLSGQNGNDIGAMMPSIKKKTSERGSTLEIRWIRSVKGAEGRIRNTLNKGSGPSYSIGKITLKSPDWEKKLIIETEAQFAAIRDIYSILIKFRIHGRAIEKAIKKYNEIF